MAQLLYSYRSNGVPDRLNCCSARVPLLERDEKPPLHCSKTVAPRFAGVQLDLTKRSSKRANCLSRVTNGLLVTQAIKSFIRGRPSPRTCPGVSWRAHLLH
jgi:hypothetical protein